MISDLHKSCMTLSEIYVEYHIARSNFKEFIVDVNENITREGLMEMNKELDNIKERKRKYYTKCG